ncbi:MAG: hypothetical protein AABY07_09920, partial [Nanoarchaeota archaeon]
DICKYLLDCYYTLPKSGNAEKPEKLVTLIDIADELFQENRIFADRDIALTIAQYGNAEFSEKDGRQTFFANSKPSIHQSPYSKIFLLPSDYVIFPLESLDIAMKSVECSLRRNKERVREHFPNFDKRILLVNHSSNVSQDVLRFLNKSYDRIFPWEWGQD